MATKGDALADAVVIGAGVVGACCAYYLTGAGLRVHLIDRDHPCAGTSGACEGNLLLWDKHTHQELTLGRMSLRLWAELAECLPRDFEYHRKGSIAVAEDEAAMAQGLRMLEALRAQGVAGEPLALRQLREREPCLALDLAGGVWFPDDAQVEPRRATVALVEAAERKGLTVHDQSPALDIVRDGANRVEAVVTPGGRLQTRHVVIAAGAWSGQVAALVGAQVPVKPRKGHIVVTERVPNVVRTKLQEVGYVATVDSDAASLAVALVAESTRSGTLLLGSSRELVGFDRSTNPQVIAAIVGRARRFLPFLGGLKAIRTYAGLRPFSPDHLPIIGPLPGVAGCYVATGHEGSGICMAPATGLLIAQWITGQDLAVPAQWFDPGRFAQEGVSEEAGHGG